MSGPAASEGNARSRRSPETVRRLLLEAASEAFGHRGFAGTSTRDIARQAGVSEALLFRHFGTKLGLFEDSVIKPFARYLDDYVTRWIAAPAASTAVVELTADYVGGLYDLLRSHREIVVALVAAYEHEDGLSDVVSDALAGPLRRVAALTAREAAARGITLPDPALTTRTFLATVMGMAVLETWSGNSGHTRSTRGEVVTEMTTMLTYGLVNRDQQRPLR